MRMSKILASFLVMLFLCVCDLGLFDKESEPEPVEITLQIQGVVTDANNDSTIVGATVTLGLIVRWNGADVLAEAYTNQEGSYFLKYICSSDRAWGESKLLIWATADGYRFHTIFGWETDHVRLTNNIQTINFQLELES